MAAAPRPGIPTNRLEEIHMRTKSFALASATALMISGLAACGGDSGGGSGGGSEAPIQMGFSPYLPGAFASLGEPMKKGAEAWVKMTNDNGGILGRDVEVIVKDDAGEQTKAIQNLRE